MDLWWRRLRIFVKEAFSCPLPPDNLKHLGTMEGIPRNGHGRAGNGFALNLVLMCHTEIVQ